MERRERWLSLAIFFSFYEKISGADLTHASQICPCLELSISRQPLDKGNQVNSSLLYQPNDVSVENKEWIEQIHANWEMLAQIDKKQKEKGDILYRYVSFPCADGQSVYQITKITRSTATLSLVTGIGDDWDIFGENTVMDLETVISNIGKRDRLHEFFRK